MGWTHGCFAGVIIEGGTSEIAGVILLSRGTGWAKASAPASNVAKSANFLCHLFIVSNPRKRPVKPVLNFINRCAFKKSKNCYVRPCTG